MNNEKGIVTTCRKVEHGFIKVEYAFLAIALIVLTGSIVIQIVCRYVLQVSSPWCEELARYLFVAITYIGSGSAFINGGHIGIDLIDTVIEGKAKDPKGFMERFNKLSDVLTIIFMVLFGVFYFQYLQQIAKHPQVSSSMHINMLIPMSSIIIGTVLMVYHAVCRLFYTYEAPSASKADE